MQWQAARACHASLPHTLHIYAKTEGHPHNYASPTSRECPQNQRKRIRLQITQYFEVCIRHCHTAAYTDTAQKRNFTTSWKSLFGHAGKPLHGAERLFRTTAKPVPHTGTVIMAHKNGSPMCPKSRFQFSKYGSVPMEASPTPHDTFPVTLPFLFREFPL